MKQYKINQFTVEQWDSIEYDWNEHEDEIVIIEKKDAYCMDITANGKRIVPILRKIEKSMTDAGLAGDDGIFAGWFGEWANELTDRSSRKYFIWNYSGKSDRERGCWSYSWGIEQIDDDLWYIFLNIAKPQQETEEAQETKEEIEEEETTMKNTKSMTKSEAIREIDTLSSSTLARICGSTNYSMIDDCCNRLILAASSMKEDAFAKCENWIDVLHTINASTDNDIDSPYLLGNMDYREYLTKYGHDEAVTILRNYIETITSEGIQNTKWEQDYIRGAKDMLAIA